MFWHGHLRLRYRRDGERTLAHDAHDGPLRVLKALHPEGPGICHHVLVHPPGGIVGGDRLDIAVDLEPGAHALVTTPGATRFYRSPGNEAVQTVHTQIGANARLEWLPLETLVHDGARARNHLRFELADGAQMIGWDMLALGLPASGRPFAQGRFEQAIEWPGLWLERGLLDFDDPAQAPYTRRLLASPLGWNRQPVLATIWCASARPFSTAICNALQESAREAVQAALQAASPTQHPTHSAHDQAPMTAGITSPHPRLVVGRLLAARTETVWQALQAIRAQWRTQLWELPATSPRVWRT